MNKGLFRRIGSGIGANALGQVATVLTQVGSLPLFLHFWGIGLYGEWLVLTAIPTYFALSDIGFSSVVANEVAMLEAREDRAQGLQAFQSVWLLISAISALVLVCVFVIVPFLPIDRWCNLHHLSQSEASIVLRILCLHVLCGLQGGMVNVGYRSTGQYARGSLILSAIRIAEFAFMVVAVVAGANAIGAAAAYLAARAIGVALNYWDARRICPWLYFGLREASWFHVRRLARPAIAFMGFPIGNALSLQGFVVVVGVALGPIATVTFSTLRTLSRFPLQVTTSINAAVWPEISMAFGANNLALARQLHLHSMQVSLYFSLAANLFIAVAGYWIVGIWSGHKIAFDFAVTYTLLAVAACNSLWSTSSVVLAATNRHQRIALWYLYSTAGSLILAYFLMVWIGLIGAALSLLFVELVMLCCATIYSAALLDENIKEFVISALMPRLPKGIFRI